jgi:hypothetical protein
MMVRLYCPKCDAPFAYVERAVETAVTCPGCGETYLPSAAGREPKTPAPPEPIPDHRPPAPDPEPAPGFDDYRPRRRPLEAIARLETPAMVLMVFTFLQSVAQVFLFGVLMLMGLRNIRGKDAEMVPFAIVFFGLALIKNAYVFRGVFAMRKGKGYRAARTGAYVALIPDVGWFFLVVAAMWCHHVLNDPAVRRSFAEFKRDDDDGI